MSSSLGYGLAGSNVNFLPNCWAKLKMRNVKRSNRLGALLEPGGNLIDRESVRGYRQSEIA